ncbi:hypothetical protein [Sodalis endosymbiont of Henestaris halophilus]
MLKLIISSIKSVVSGAQVIPMNTRLISGTLHYANRLLCHIIFGE